MKRGSRCNHRREEGSKKNSNCKIMLIDPNSFLIHFLILFLIKFLLIVAVVFHIPQLEVYIWSMTRGFAPEQGFCPDIGELGRILTYLGWGDVRLFNHIFFYSSRSSIPVSPSVSSASTVSFCGGCVCHPSDIHACGPGWISAVCSWLCWTPASAVRRGVGRLGGR